MTQSSLHYPGGTHEPEPATGPKLCPGGLSPGSAGRWRVLPLIHLNFKKGLKMNWRYLWISMISALVVVVLAGCITPPAEGALEVVISQTAYGYEATANVGGVHVDSPPLEITASITNISGLNLELLSVTVSGPFSIDLSEGPISIDAGGSLEATLSFDPEVVGEATGTLEATLDGATIPFVLNLTGTGLTDVTNLAKLVVDSTDRISGSEWEFGFVDPDAPASVDVSLVNISDIAIDLTSVSAPSNGVTLNLPDVPTALPAGDSVAGTLTFAPGISGPVNALVMVEIDVAASPFVLGVGGEGNYAPTIIPIVEVTSADVGAVVGVYERTEEISGWTAVYRFGDYVIYGWPNDGIQWGIDDDLDNTDTYFTRHTHDCYSGPSVPSWSTGSLGTGTAASVGEIACPTYQNLYDGDTASPNYIFSDAEGDAAGTTLYQWYEGVAFWDDFTEISGASSANFVASTAFHDMYLKVLVTPVAADGTPTGSPVWFGPSPQVYAPPLP